MSTSDKSAYTSDNEHAPTAEDVEPAAHARSAQISDVQSSNLPSHLTAQTPRSEIQDDLGISSPDDSTSSTGHEPTAGIQDALPASYQPRRAASATPWPRRTIVFATMLNLACTQLIVVALWWTRTSELDGVSLAVLVGFLGAALVGAFCAMAYSAAGLVNRSWRAASRGQNVFFAVVGVSAVALLLLGGTSILDSPSASVLAVVGIPMLIFALPSAHLTSAKTLSPNGTRSALQVTQPSTPGLLVLTSAVNVLWIDLFLALLFFDAQLDESPIAPIKDAGSVTALVAIIAGVYLTSKGNLGGRRLWSVLGQAILFGVLLSFTWAAFRGDNTTLKITFALLLVPQAALIWSASTPSASEDDARMPQDSIPSDEPPNPHMTQSDSIVLHTIFNAHIGYVAVLSLWYSMILYGVGGRERELGVTMVLVAVTAFAAIGISTIGLLRTSQDTRRLGHLLVRDTLFLAMITFAVFLIVADSDYSSTTKYFLMIWLTFVAFFPWFVVLMFVESTGTNTLEESESESSAGHRALTPTQAHAEAESDRPREPVQLQPPGFVLATTLTNLHWVYMMVALLLVRDLPIALPLSVYPLSAPLALLVFVSLLLAWPQGIRQRPKRAFFGNWSLLAVLCSIVFVLLFSGSAAVGLALVPLLVLQSFVVWWTKPSNPRYAFSSV